MNSRNLSISGRRSLKGESRYADDEIPLFTEKEGGQLKSITTWRLVEPALGRLLQLMRLIINRPTVVEKFYYDFIIIIKQKMIPHVNV